MTDDHANMSAGYQRAKASLARSPLQFNLRTLLVSMGACSLLALALRWAGGGTVLNFAAWSAALLTAAIVVWVVHYLTRLDGLLVGGLAALCFLAVLTTLPLWFEADYNRSTARPLNWDRVSPRAFFEPYVVWLIVDGLAAGMGIAIGVTLAWRQRRKRAAYAQDAIAAHDDMRFQRTRTALAAGRRMRFWTGTLFAVFGSAALAWLVGVNWEREFLVQGATRVVAALLVLAISMGVTRRMRQPAIFACTLAAMVCLGLFLDIDLRDARDKALTPWIVARAFLLWLVLFAVVGLVGMLIGGGIAFMDKWRGGQLQLIAFPVFVVVLAVFLSPARVYFIRGEWTVLYVPWWLGLGLCCATHFLLAQRVRRLRSKPVLGFVITALLCAATWGMLGMADGGVYWPLRGAPADVAWPVEFALATGEWYLVFAAALAGGMAVGVIAAQIPKTKRLDHHRFEPGEIVAPPVENRATADTCQAGDVSV